MTEEGYYSTTKDVTSEPLRVNKRHPHIEQMHSYSWHGYVRIDFAGNLCIMVKKEYIDKLIKMLSDYQSDDLVGFMKAGENNG
jgi:hypothetical protein